MFKFRDPSFAGISHKSIQHSLTSMSQRAPVAGFVQIFLYPAVTLSGPELRNDPVIYVGWAMMWMVALLRVLQLRYIKSSMARPNYLLEWRLWFGTSAQLISISWGLTCAHAIMQYGLTPLTSSILVACLGTIALYSASYPLDWINNICFQVGMMVPISAALWTTPETRGLAFGGALYLCFSLAISSTLRRSQHTLLNNVEEFERLHKEIKEKHDLIRTMLASIDEVFLILDLNGKCTVSGSVRSKELLGLDPMNMELTKILRSEGAKAHEIEEWYQILASDRMDFDIVCGLGPETLDLAGGTMRLRMKFHAMRDADGKLQAVVLTALNVTKEMLQQLEIEVAQDRAELIVGVHGNRLGFRALLAEFEAMTERAANWNGGALDKLRFDLHTLKGNATLMGALGLGKLVQTLEMTVRENLGDDKVVRAAGQLFRQGFQDWSQREHPVLEKIGLYDDSTIQISRLKLDRLKGKWQAQPQTRGLYERLEADLFNTEFGELFAPFENQVNFAAEKSGKLARLVIEESKEPLFINPNDYREIFQPMVHLFTNAVDHGIEAPDERVEAGKPETGTITVRYQVAREKQGEIIIIEVQDDGRGINIPKLRKKLTDLGMPPMPSESDLKVAARIFDEGLSTRDEVTELSGQGVGLGAVYSAVTRAGGEVAVMKTSSQGTIIRIVLPRVGARGQSMAV